ncbi:MAG: CdaR family protein [Acidobacteriota bacterium]|nr:CdaR family protein [Acidobacteriota bacterium]MDQ7087682.1 CdaR family protein [Acidobacteriota bacterium]
MRGFFRRNMGLKLLSLLLAFILWASVVTRSPEVRWYEVPVRFKTGPDLIVTNPAPAMVGIQLSGSSTILDRVAPDEIYAEVDVSHLAPGSHRVAVVPEEIRRVPRGVSDISVVHALISVTLDARRTTLVPVVLVLGGELPDGYEVVESEVKPSDVEVSGPEKEVLSVRNVPTEPFDLSALTRSSERMLKLVLPEANVRLAPATVRARVQIREVPTSFSLQLTVRPSEPGWRVEPEAVTLSFLAPPSLFTPLSEQLQATASVDALGSKAGEVAVTLSWGNLDTDELALVSDVKVEPARVKVRPN